MKIISSAIIVVLLISLVCICSAVEEAVPEFGNCVQCHSDIAENLTTSLHYTGRGMMAEYEKGAAAEFGIDMDEFYTENNCSSCHVTTCNDCHGEDPHTEDLSKNIETCDKCHLKKQATFVGDMPAHKSKGPSADIHYEKGFVCTDCHTADEIHGDGVEYDNMLSAVKVTCEDCHQSPGKTVKEMNVTQYSSNTESHKIHEGTLDCSACHVAWMVTCVNCHLDTMKTESITTDKFYLARSADGKIKPFIQMIATYDNKTHIAYAEYFTHAVSEKARDCAFCHENKEVLCDGSEGQMLGPEGASFIPSETIERIYGMTPTPTPTTSPTQTQPGFEATTFVLAGLLAIAYIMRKRNLK